MQISYSRYYGAHTSFTEVYNVCIVFSPHAKPATQALESLANQFKRSHIGEWSSLTSNFSQKTTVCAISGPDLHGRFSSDFVSAIDALCTTSLFESEIEYIKAFPQYEAFLSSSLLKDLSSAIEHFEKNGYNDGTGWDFGMSDITRCELSRPNCSPFKFTLSTNRYDSMPQMHKHVNLLRGKTYRFLSISEISMLTVALSERFPHLFTCTWMLYSDYRNEKNFLGQRKKCMTFEFGLTPCIVKKAPKPNPKKQNELADIY